MRYLIVVFYLLILASCGDDENTLTYPAVFDFTLSTASEPKTFDISTSNFSEVPPNVRYQSYISVIESPTALAASDYADFFPIFESIQLLSQDSLRLFSNLDPQLQLLVLPYTRNGSSIFFEQNQSEICPLKFELNTADDELSMSYSLAIYHDGFGPNLNTENCDSKDHSSVLENILTIQNIDSDTISIVLYEDIFSLEQ